MSYDTLETSRTQRTLTGGAELLLALHLDGPLFIALCLVGGVGSIVLFSASGRSMPMLEAHLLRFALGLVAMIMLAQIPPRLIRTVAPWAYVIGLLLLFLVMFLGDISMGAQRWLDLGVVRFQPSEIMKLAVPLACAWFLHERPLPPSFASLAIVGVAIGLPALLRYILSVVGLLIPVAYGAWAFLLHDYQRQRILTFLDPQSDPLGSGYHIIQSQIAIGSGGVFGKGYLNGSQAQLEFLPERSTDFIFAVVGEEWGLIGLVTVICLFMFVIGRALYLSATAQDTFARLASGSLALTFCVYVFVNTGMVTGLMPVVGVPLPFISYGGTAMVTLMAGFGILMSLCAKRKLVSR
jgi:rod shape determining protein RodA